MASVKKNNLIQFLVLQEFEVFLNIIIVND